MRTAHRRSSSHCRPGIALALLLGCGFASVPAQDQCRPIGWATRVGRTSEPFELTGGGDATPILVTNLDTLQKYVADSLPRVLHIYGTLGRDWSGVSGDYLQITGSNKTIAGLVPGTTLKAPIVVDGRKGARNIAIRNIVIRGPGSSWNSARPNISVENGARNVWIDHCEFRNGENGNARITKGADNVSFTWCIIGYSQRGVFNLSSLIGSSDNEPISEGKLNATFMYDWWDSGNQRQPRTRYGNIHVVNNLYTTDTALLDTSIVALGITNGFNSLVRTENNHFIGTTEPIDLGKTSGASAQETIGNMFQDCKGNQVGSGTSFTPPYEYASSMVEASKVESLVRRGAGATLASPTSCGGISTDAGRNPGRRTTRRIVRIGRNLSIEGFDGKAVELVVVSPSGSPRFRTTFPAATDAHLVDLSGIALPPGFHLAIARAHGTSSQPVLLPLP